MLKKLLWDAVPAKIRYLSTRTLAPNVAAWTRTHTPGLLTPAELAAFFNDGCAGLCLLFHDGY